MEKGTWMPIGNGRCGVVVQRFEPSDVMLANTLPDAFSGHDALANTIPSPTISIPSALTAGSSFNTGGPVASTASTIPSVSTPAVSTATSSAAPAATGNLVRQQPLAPIITTTLQRVSDSRAISLELADKVLVFEQCGLWFRGCVFTYQNNVQVQKLGIFPASHVLIQGKQRPFTGSRADLDKEEIGSSSNLLSLAGEDSKKKLASSTVLSPGNSLASIPAFAAKNVSAENIYSSNGTPPIFVIPTFIPRETTAGAKEPLVDEISYVLQEWNQTARDALIRQDYTAFRGIRDYIQSLFKHRKLLIMETGAAVEKLRKDLVLKILLGNQLQSLEYFVVHEAMTASIADERRFSLPSIHQHHLRLSRIKEGMSDQMELNILLSGDSDSLEPDLEMDNRLFSLLLEFKASVAVICKPREYVELRFSTFHGGEGKFISEEYSVELDYNGMVRDQKNIGKQKTIFTDIFPKEVNSLCLVCRMVINRTQSSSKSIPTIEGTTRYPYGWGFLKVDDTLRRDKTISMPIYQSISDSSFAEIPELIARNADLTGKAVYNHDIISLSCTLVPDGGGGDDKLLKSFQQCLPTYRLNSTEVLRPYDNRNTITVTIASGDFQLGRKSGGKYMEVCAQVFNITGELVRDALYSSSASSMPSSTYHSLMYQPCSNPRWMEPFRIDLPLERFHNWTLLFIIRQCGVQADKGGSGVGSGGIFGGGMGKETTSSSGGFSEPLPVAFGFIPLTDISKMVIPDKLQTLNLYKYEPHLFKSTLYLRLPPFQEMLSQNSTSGGNEVISDMKTVLLKDTLQVRTQLYSSSITQNQALFQLLRWRDFMASEEKPIQALLNAIPLIGEFELVKFQVAILDSLFSIFSHPANRSGHFDMAVFGSMVYVLNMITDRRFRTFLPTLQGYISDHIFGTAISRKLSKALCSKLMDTSSPENSRSIRETLKVWEYLVDIIIHSWSSVTADLPKQRSGLLEEMEVITSVIMELFQRQEPSHLYGTQVIAMQRFPYVLEKYAKVYTNYDMLQLLERCFKQFETLPEKLQPVVYSLLRVLSLNIMKGFPGDPLPYYRLIITWTAQSLQLRVARMNPSGDNDAGLPILTHSLSVVSNAMVLIALLVENQHRALVVNGDDRLRPLNMQLALLIPTLILMLENSRPSDRFNRDHPHQDGSNYGLLPSILGESSGSINNLLSQESGGVPISSHPSTMSSSTSGSSTHSDGDIAACIFGIANLLTETELQNYLQNYCQENGSNSTAIFLSHIVSGLENILGRNVFPRSWFNMNMTLLKVSFKMIKIILQFSLTNLTESTTSKDHKLWSACLSFLIQFLSHPDLQIEHFSPQKLYVALQLNLDIRNEAAALLMSSWVSENIDTLYRANNLDMGELLGTLLTLTMVPHKGSRNAGFHLLVNILNMESETKNSLNRVQMIWIDALEKMIVAEDIMKAKYPVRFLLELEANVSKRCLPHTQPMASKLIQTLTHFVELLVDLRSLPDGEEYADDRVLKTLKLLNFFLLIDRTHIYIKYVHQLADFHIKRGRKVEAGFSLKLHADLLGWSTDEILDRIVDPSFPEQSSFERKKNLYLKSINLFDEGKAWEIAIPMCKELAVVYEFVMFEYGRLAIMLELEATFVRNITQKERYSCEYFRVGYFGKGFPASKRNKQFIHRGYELEKISSFCERMLKKHPAALILNSNEPPGDAILHSNQQYLQIATVCPEPAKDHPLLSIKTDIPDFVRSYYEFNHVNTFSFLRPLKIPGKEPTSSVDIWVEKTILVTEISFPSVLGCSEVVSLEKRQMSPIESAVNTMERKNKELLALERKFGSFVGSEKINCSPLTMALSGACDAPVNGGLPMYRQAFLSDTFLENNPDKAGLVKQLKTCIREQAQIISQLITIHGRLVTPAIRPLHESIVGFFHKTFAVELKTLATSTLTIQSNGSLYRSACDIQSIKEQSKTTEAYLSQLSNISIPWHVGLRPSSLQINPTAITDAFVGIDIETSSSPIKNVSRFQETMVGSKKNGNQLFQEDSASLMNTESHSSSESKLH